jgi:hypothetical protein
VTLPLRLLFPNGNPDFDAAYEYVVDWWLEVDENNVVRREIGFDSSGNVIAAAPLGENHGIFTDIQSAPDGLGPEVQAVAFQAKWQEISERWRLARFAKQ